MLIPGTTHICLVAPKNVQGHKKNFLKWFMWLKHDYKQDRIKKLQGASSWSYASTEKSEL